MAERTNRSCVLITPGVVEIQNRPVPVAGPDDVLVEITVTGICGTDLHQYLKGGVGSATVDGKPFVMGHESAGTIVEVGANVTTHKVGDRCAIEPGFPCEKCNSCSQGFPNMCLDLKYMALPPTDGSLCQYWAGPAKYAIKIADEVSDEEAGCIQPLAVAVELSRRGGFRPGCTVAIFGAGPLGVLISAVAKAKGASKVIMFDISESRTAFATTYCADYAAVARPKRDDEEPLDYARSWTKEHLALAGIEYGVDIAVEASGAASCMQAACCILRHGGTYVQAGLGPVLQMFPTFEVVLKGLNVHGTVRYGPGCFEESIDLMAKKLVDLKPLVTKSFPLTQSEEAFLAVKAGKDMKILIWNQK